MSADTIVVAGAGIIGASLAYHLSKRGARVAIIDEAAPGSGASGKSFGWLNATFSKRPKEYFDLNVLGMREWRRLESELRGGVKVQYGGSAGWFPEGKEAAEITAAVDSHRNWGYATRLIGLDE